MNDVNSGLNGFFSDLAAQGALQQASRLRIGEDYLANLDGPPMTMLQFRGFGTEAQKNTIGQASREGGKKKPDTLHWPILVGTEALSGLEAQITLQSGALVFEFERLLNLPQGELSPGADSTLAPAVEAALRERVEAGAIFVVAHSGFASKLVGGKSVTFPTFRVSSVTAPDGRSSGEVMADFVRAWHASARVMPRKLLKPADAPAQLTDDGPAG
jgi:hypothetical protein